jgi:hypothetical protein
MAIAIQPYTEDRTQAVVAFNQRLAQGGSPAEFRFPESNIPHWLPKKDGRRIFQEYYLAIENEFVRGGFILKYQDFALRGQNCPVAYYHLPISEGIVSKAYTSTGVLMLRSAMKMQPMLFALGMGSFENPLPTMLKAMGWSLSALPFYFRVNHPSRFLRNISPLRKSRPGVALANVAAFTGAGWAGIKTIQWMRSHNTDRGLEIEPVTTFGAWADEFWQKCAPLYAMIASRESSVLNCLYPPGKSFLCFKILRGSQIAGWAVVLDTQMRKNKYFGDLRVGSLVDCLATPENAPAVVQAAAKMLDRRGVDLVVSNHSHAAWGKAFRTSGFLSAPSNFIFAASKPLAQQLAPWASCQHEVYLMRGDGDGPVNL